MPDEPVLPELARSLRALGDVRDAASETAHAAVFTPLLDARARAARAGLGDAMSEFRGQALAARIVARAGDAARAVESNPAHARARAARARELLDPLRAELEKLDALGVAAQRSASEPDGDAWVTQLAHVFRIADVACGQLARLLAEPAAVPEPRGWLGRLGR